MRRAFFDALAETAARDPRVVLMTADLGMGFVDAFASRFPDRFVNVGISEQNLSGVAAGLAMSGRVVFTYSIGNFPTLRCLEQIRNDICYHQANVKIVAGGGGLAYGSLGMSHHATEDLAIMRALPGLVVEAPGDAGEAAAATGALATLLGPAYLRLGRDEPAAYPMPAVYEIGRAIKVRPGRDLTLVSTGGMLALAIEAADRLRADGLTARVLSMHTVKPLDEEAVLAAARETRAIFTIEEHSIVGGLGSAVAEVLAESAAGGTFFRRLALPDAYVSMAGSQAFLRERAGLSTDAIVAAVAGAFAVPAAAVR